MSSAEEPTRRATGGPVTGLPAGGAAAAVPPARWSGRQFLLALITFGAVALVTGYFVATHVHGAIETAAIIARPHDVQSQLERTLSVLDALQDSVQDYLIDGADGMRVQYEEASAQLKNESGALAKFGADELAAADRNAIQAGVARLLASSGAVIATRRARGPDEARTLMTEDLAAFDDVQRIVREQIAQQKARLRMHEQALQLNVSRYLTILVGVLAGGVLAAAVLVLYSDRRRQNEIQGLLRSENERLEAAVRERSAVLARANRELAWFSRGALQTQEQERRMLALELHDQVGQELAALVLSLSRCLQELPEGTPPDTRELLEDGIEIARAAYGDVHNLALDLRPAMLDRLGLGPTLQWYVKRQSRNAGCEIDLAVDQLPAALPPDLAITAFRIVQEAISNAIRHARASRIDVQARLLDGRIEISVRDNGCGFDPEQGGQDTEPRRGLGLLGMRQRAEDAGGTFSIRSRAGEGTGIIATLPAGAIPNA